MRIEQRHLLFLLMLGVVYIGTGIGLRDPWPSDEPRYALMAQTMVESGEWLFPRRGGELYPDKPPMFMWSQAIVYQLTGNIRVATLLPSLLFGLVTLGLVYAAGRLLWGPREGFLAAMLLLVTPQFVLEARAGQLDAMVVMWISLGMYAFLRHLLQGPDRKWLYVGFAACGLGVITKGVGFLPLLVFVPWLIHAVRVRQPVSGRALARDAGIGLAIMLAAIACWLVPMLIQVELANDPAYAAYRDNILFKQTGERYLEPSHHFKPWWYFLVEVIPALWLPLFLLGFWLVPRWWQAWRDNNAPIVLLTGWVVLVVLFFTLSPAKRGVYILPALPWACLAAAPWLAALLQRRGVRVLALVVSLTFSLVLLAGATWLTWIRPEKAAELVQKYEFDPASALWLAGVCALLATLVLGVRRRRPPEAYAGVMLVLWLVLGLWVYPRLDETKSGRGLMLEVEQAVPADRPLALVDWKEQTLLQARRPTTNFGFLVPLETQARSAVAWLERHPDGMVLIQGRSLAPCFSAGTPVAVGVAHRREWYLVDRSNVVDSCRERDAT